MSGNLNEKFGLGQRVLVLRTACGVTGHGKVRGRHGTYDKRWIETKPAPGVLFGVVAGRRNMWEGWVERGWGDDSGTEFHPTGHRQVILVAVSQARMVRALPEDVLPVESPLEAR